MKRDSTAYGAVRPVWDRSDCSVRALACATGCTYEQASAIFSVAGRTIGRGTNFLVSSKVYEEFLGMVKVDVKDCQLAVFMAGFPSGAYVLHRAGHAFAVVEGVLMDWENSATRPRSKLVGCWAVTAKTLEKIERTKELFK